MKRDSLLAMARDGRCANYPSGKADDLVTNFPMLYTFADFCNVARKLDS